MNKYDEQLANKNIKLEKDCADLILELADLRKENEALKKNYYQKICDDCKYNKLPQELAELKANGIFPKFKIGTKVYIIENDKIQELIIDKFCEPKYDCKYDQEYPCFCYFYESLLFASQAEALVKLEEMRKEKE